MGLDQYAYVASRAGEMNDYYESSDYETNSTPVVKPREIAYWRKHPNLQGWMEQLWIDKGCHNPEDDPSFNGVEVELTWEDLVQLEQAVKEGELPKTRGFFFGEDSDEYYKDADLKFIREARAELFMGLKVFYNSSW